MPRHSVFTTILIVAVPSLCWSQTAPAATAPAPLSRWLEIPNATLSVRYRFVDNSSGTVTTNSVQHREILRARFKLDEGGRHALNLGASSGSRFTSGWNNTGVGIGDWQGPLSMRALYFSAQPIAGVEGQYGSMFILKGQSTEITTYDDDGYVIGQRVSVRRPRQLFFDELSATVGYFSGDPAEIGVSRRVKYLNDRPNYGHFLVDKKAGTRAAFSADFTSVGGDRTWRTAANVNTQELRLADSILVESYKRTNRNPDYGFAVSFDKALNRRTGLNWGYARIDPSYGGLNSDRFNIGKRVFVTMAFRLSQRFTASAFITTAVGDNVRLPQRTVSNLILTYNMLPELRRTGLF